VVVIFKNRRLEVSVMLGPLAVSRACQDYVPRPRE
jgi:hypothetical protein